MRLEDYKVVLFDLGNTLIRQQVDSQLPLDQLQLELLPGVAEMIRYAARRCDLGIITNTEISPEDSVRRSLKRLGLVECFVSVTTSVDVGVKKPHPEIFLAALSKHNALPRAAIMVGDNYHEDILPSKELGITTILVTGDRRRNDHAYASADYVVANARSLLALLRS